MRNYKNILIAIALLALFPLFYKHTADDYKRMNLNSNLPFIYDATQFTFGILNSAVNSHSSNWFQGLAVILSPIAIVMIPSSLFADTISLPYDHYKYKKYKPTIMYWKQAFAHSGNNIEPDSLETLTSYYGDYGAGKIHGEIQREYLKYYPNYAFPYVQLAANNQEYKYSGDILRLISDDIYLSNEIKNDICKLSITDIKKYQQLIFGFIQNETTPLECLHQIVNHFPSDELGLRRYQTALFAQLYQRLLATNDDEHTLLAKKTAKVIVSIKLNMQLKGKIIDIYDNKYWAGSKGWVAVKIEAGECIRLKIRQIDTININDTISGELKESGSSKAYNHTNNTPINIYVAHEGETRDYILKGLCV